MRTPTLPETDCCEEAGSTMIGQAEADRGPTRHARHEIGQKPHPNPSERPRHMLPNDSVADLSNRRLESAALRCIAWRCRDR